mmetsp:Transcript_8375/g.17244  ORF Transcript_8375/g.17244 Transcript_8375/m.17244 type:complete len:220 (-) Transcript_8375:414-1073(-)
MIKSWSFTLGVLKTSSGSFKTCSRQLLVFQFIDKIYAHCEQQLHSTSGGLPPQSTTKLSNFISLKEQTSTGITPVNSFVSKYAIVKFPKLAMDDGIVPVSLFSHRDKFSRSSKLPISLESGPCRLLLSKSRFRKPVIEYRDSGIVPVKLFLSMSKVNRFLQSPMLSGSEPPILLPSKSITSKKGRPQISNGRVPPSPFSSLLKSVITRSMQKVLPQSHS